MDYTLAKNIVLVINLCICLSYPLNFGIYCGMSRQFRETFRAIVLAPLWKVFKAGEKLEEEEESCKLAR